MPGPAPWFVDGPPVGRDIGIGTARDMAFDAFNQLVAAVEKYRVYIACEQCFGHLCHDYGLRCRPIDHHDSSHLCINWDPSHDALAGRRHTCWVTKLWDARIICRMHLKDGVGEPRKDRCNYVMFDQGHANWTGLWRAGRDRL